MPTTFNLAPVPRWYFNDTLGNPLRGGFMKTYRNTVRSQYKAVYSDIAGLHPYPQPITFDQAGSAGPFYWASDENYFLEIYDYTGRLIRTVVNYNAPGSGGSGPITTNEDLTNFIPDPQFNYNVKDSFSTLATNQIIGSPYLEFSKNNTTATDNISFIEFNLGDAVPPNSPPKYFQYECTVAGTGETYKDYEVKFPNVRSFESQTVSFGFWGKSPTVANEVELIVKQYYGTGGTPSPTVETSIATFTLTSSWAQYSHNNFVIPSNVGASLGTNGDDYLSILLRFPLNVQTTINIVNEQMNLGASLLDLDYEPPSGSTPRAFRFIDTKQTESAGMSPTVSSGLVQWLNVFPISGGLYWTGNIALIPPNFLIAAGQSLLVASYPDLFAVYGYFYGGSGANFNMPLIDGYFLRTLDVGSGIDPGRVFGSAQASQNLAHTHTSNPDAFFAFDAGGTQFLSFGPAPNNAFDVTTVTVGTSGSGGSEARPINKAFPFIIRVL